MEIEVRPFEGTVREFVEAGELAFSAHVEPEDLPGWERIFELDRAIGAYDGTRVVGTTGAFSFQLTIPGAVVPAAGVTLVGVHPTHRRRGILRRMMRFQLDDVRRRGEALAILWASEGGIYQRFGYGLATLLTRLEIERARSAFRRPHAPSGTVRFIAPEEAPRILPPIHAAVAPTRPGLIARTPAFWESETFHDPPHRRRGATAAFYAVHETDGVADGYVRYRVRRSEGDEGRSTVVVTEKLATSPAAELELWQFLLGIDLMTHVEAWNVAPDDPIILSVLEPRRLGIGIEDGIWLRVVDVAAALAQRRYAVDGRLVLELDDAFCPWNAGRWALAVEDGVPAVAASDSPPDLQLDVTDLGTAFLGAFSFTRLADAARVVELRPGALERADALFRTRRPPWCDKVF